MIAQANALKDKKEFEKAKEIYSKAIEQDGLSTEAYLGLASTYENLDNKEKTIETYKQASALEPENTDILLKYGERLIQAGSKTLKRKMYLRKF